MIDFHSHILPNIDDGSSSIEETINLIKEAKEVGFTGIISTSHYIQGYYETNENDRKTLLENVQTHINDVITDNCPKLYLGSEAYVSNEMIELIKNKEISTINNSKYILFELPMNSKPLFAKDIVYKLVSSGYIPVIAHPERYTYVQEDIGFAEELANMGTLFQANYGSIIGIYGVNAKKTVKKLLQKDLIYFLGSDVHSTEYIYTKIPKILKKLSKIVTQKKLEELTTLNAQKVLDNEEIE